MYVVDHGLRSPWIKIFVLFLVVTVFLIVSPIRGAVPPVTPAQEERNTPTPPPLPMTVSPVQPSEQAVREALGRANSAFRDARLHADPALLSGVATGPWMAYEQGRIADLHAQQVTERWEQVSVLITYIDVRAMDATVCTIESWNKSVINADGTINPPTTENWNERYTLVRQGETWLVSDIQYPKQECVL